MSKTFRQLMTERSADDYVGRPADDEEATRNKKYRSKGEQDFADQHAVVKTDHPVATDAQFSSSKISSAPHKGFDPNTAGEVKPIPQGGSAKSFKEAFMDEEVDLSEGVLETLRKIVKDKAAQTVKFKNNKSLKVDMTTANALVRVHDNLNDTNQKRFAQQLDKGPSAFMKMADFAFSVGK